MAAIVKSALDDPSVAPNRPRSRDRADDAAHAHRGAAAAARVDRITMVVGEQASTHPAVAAVNGPQVCTAGVVAAVAARWTCTGSPSVPVR